MLEAENSDSRQERFVDKASQTGLSMSRDHGVDAMNCHEEELAHLVKDALEIESLDDPAAPDPRTESCLKLSRVQAIVAGVVATAEEEAHFDTCRLCESRKRAFERRRDRYSSVEEQPTSGSFVWSTPRIVIGGLALATAAAVMAAVLWVGDEALGLRADCSTTEERLFAPVRGASDGQEFYVGVKVSRAAWVRLLAVEKEGSWQPLDLDRGKETLRLEPGRVDAYGPYSLPDDANLETIVVLAAPKPLDWVTIENLLEASPSPTDEAGLTEIVRLFERELACEVQTVEVPRPSVRRHDPEQSE